MRFCAAVVFLLVSALLLGVNLLVGTDFAFGWYVAGIVALLGILVSIVGWVSNGRVLSGMKEFGRGEYVAHWKYSPKNSQAAVSGSDPSVSLFEVYIGTHACYYFGAFIEWNVQRCTLEEVVWRDGTPAMLDFVLLDYWSNLRETKRVFPIPVPAGKEAEARRVIRTMDKVERPEQWLHQLDIAFAVIPAIVTLIFLLLRIAA